jgi:uncharacterized membrane protein
MRRKNPLLDFHPQVISPQIIWIYPVLYLLLALVLGLIFPQVDRLIYGKQSLFSATTATSLLSTIASGMIAFTGFVFSMLIVMVQFGSSAYSPRIAKYLMQDPAIAHALGVFIATFTYSLIALTQVGFINNEQVPDLTVATAIVFLFASVLFFLRLISRTSMLQVNNVIDMIGTGGTRILEEMYPLLPQPVLSTGPSTSSSASAIDPIPHDINNLPQVLDEIFYTGRLQRILEFNLGSLVALAQKFDILIQIEHAVGDTVGNHFKIISIRGNHSSIPSKDILLRAIKLGPQRTIEQDSRFAIRLIVDIGIRALSPAVNDPTTAVQALDQLDDLLRRIAARDLNIGYLYDQNGNLRVIYPTPDWNDFLTLAVDEIRFYGAKSYQVMRRLRALLLDLRETVPFERAAAVEHQLERVEATITSAFPDKYDQALAREADHQGISIVK